MDDPYSMKVKDYKVTVMREQDMQGYPWYTAGGMTRMKV